MPLCNFGVSVLGALQPDARVHLVADMQILSHAYAGDASRPRSPLGATEKLGGRAWVQGFTGHVPHERGAYGVTKAR